MDIAPAIKRKPGRPKTKHYITITARVPLDLAREAQRHILEHHITVSDLIRTGIVAVLCQFRAVPAPSAIAQQAFVPTEHARMNTESLQALQASIAPQYQSTVLWQFAPDALPANRVLGKLCPGQHEYMHTGQTLLTALKRQCLQCEAARKRAKRATQKAGG